MTTRSLNQVKAWSAGDIGDQTGRTVVVTGANSGLGLETSRVLAAKGARVLMAGRSAERLDPAVADVARTAGGPAPEAVVLDLASLDSIRTAADHITDSVDHLDVLVNNAGIMAPPLELTADGFESQIGVNHLGHFALTGLLLPLLAGEGARVVNVSSLAHQMGSLDPDDLMWQRRGYSAWPAYGQSKLANLLFTAELSRRAQAAGWPLIVAAAHPGYSSTNLQYAAPEIARNRVGRLAMRLMTTVIGQSAADGALPQLYAVTAPDVHGDDYFGPRSMRESRGAPQRVGRRSAARDRDLAERLWDRSEELTGVHYDFTRS